MHDIFRNKRAEKTSILLKQPQKEIVLEGYLLTPIGVGIGGICRTMGVVALRRMLFITGVRALFQ